MGPSTSHINRLKRQILLAGYNAQEGHLPSALSILDIIWVLYDRVLRFDPVKPRSEERDRFVLSKGHGSLALYAVLAEKGFFPVSELDNFCSYASLLGGHPDCNKIPGVEASTGSLGHGLPIAVGMALGLKIKRNPSGVYALVGDGECNEGSIWEAALLASYHRLDRLCCIVDYNHSGDRALNLGDLVAKFSAFGWTCRETSGHDHKEIYRTLTSLSTGLPTVVIAHTIKGYGLTEMENNPAWHHRAPSSVELQQFLAKLL
jgi:transketolase